MAVPGLSLVLVVISLVCTIVAVATPRVPLWIGQFVLCIAVLAMLLGGR